MVFSIDQTNIKVSVLIPTFNRLNYLKDSLSSVQNQIYQNIEIIVSDDGSTDGSFDYVREAQKSDQRIKLYNSNPNRGLFTNVNFMLDKMTGDAFCILGDDDKLDVCFLDKLTGPLYKYSDVGTVFCDHRVIDATGNYLHKKSIKNSFSYGRSSLKSGKIQDPVVAALRQSICIGFALFRSQPFKEYRFVTSYA
jgi:glycosyltransferase involved in cell wall biosynthesis